MKIDTLYIVQFMGNNPDAQKEIKARDLKKGDKLVMIGVQGNTSYAVDGVIEKFKNVAKVWHRFNPVVNSNYYATPKSHMLETVILEIQ